MSTKKLYRWILLAITLSFTVYFSWMASQTHDEGTRMAYLGLLAAPLLSLPLTLESLGLLGKERDEYEIIDKKLREVYSPIHAMKVTIEQEMSRAGAIVEGVVPASLLDLEKLSAIFRQYTHELGNHHLEMWLSIEKEINEIPRGMRMKRDGFHMNKARLDWFDQLEAKYQELTRELKKQE